MKIAILLLASWSALNACKKKDNSGKAPVQSSESKPADSGPIMEGDDEGKAKPGGDPVAPDGRPLAGTVSTDSFACASLDYGLYWFGKGDVAQKAGSAYRSSFYDPLKPTVIYVHGWSMGSHQLQKRTTFNYSKTDPFQGLKKDAADAWVDAGWNIGIFYWNQFADETNVKLAEDKIWTEQSLTWRDCDGKEVDSKLPGSAADLFFQTYTEALKDYKGPHIRIAGHSLGNQMATRLAALAADAAKAGKIDVHLVPKRVALLDPFWSRSFDPSKARGTQVRSLITSLKAQGMIFEWYRSSDLTEDNRADQNLELLSVIGQTEVLPDYYRNQAARHAAAPHLYFLSFANPPPKGCKAPCTDLAPSAATDDARMLELMNRAARFQQSEGMNTADTADNAFIPRLK